MLIGRLLSKGVSRGEIMARMGYKTAQSIANFELWLSLPHDVQRAVHNEEIAFTTGVEIARVAQGNDEAARETLAQAREYVAAAGGRRRVTVRSVKRPRGNRTPAETTAQCVRTLDKIQNQSDPKALAKAFSVKDYLQFERVADFLACIGGNLGARMPGRHRG